jgi:peptide deformylase
VAEAGRGFGGRDGADLGQQLQQGRLVGAYPTVPPEVGRGSLRRITEVGEEVLRQPGLAANQVGVDLRLFVFDCLDGRGGRHVGHIANPVLELPGPGERRLVEEAEGCLSVPGATVVVPRTTRAVVRGFDKDGAALVIEGDDYFARCLQHETDHLSGTVYLDRLSKRNRKDALRQMEDRREAVFARRATMAAKLNKQVKSEKQKENLSAAAPSRSIPSTLAYTVHHDGVRTTPSDAIRDHHLATTPAPAP